jgi:hypothetical protein
MRCLTPGRGFVVFFRLAVVNVGSFDLRQIICAIRRVRKAIPIHTVAPVKDACRAFTFSKRYCKGI